MPNAKTNKVYFAGAATFLDRAWLRAAGAPRNCAQGSLLIIAPTKRAATAMLAERGRGAPERLVNELRVMSPDPWFTPLKGLVDAGVIDPRMEGVYVWYDIGERIVRIDPGGTATLIALTEYDKGKRDRVVIPVATTEMRDDLVEKVARTLAYRQAQHDSNGQVGVDSDDYFELVMGEDGRKHYRALAREVVELTRKGTG